MKDSIGWAIDNTFHIFSIFNLYWSSLLKNNLIFQKIYPTNVSKNATVNTFTQRGNICILPKLANASASFFKNLYPVSSKILSSVFFKVLKQEVINIIHQNYIPLLLFICVQTRTFLWTMATEIVTEHVTTNMTGPP